MSITTAGNLRGILPSICRNLSCWVPLGVALVLLLVAIFGGFLGLDPDMKWGTVRVMALGAGLAVFGLAAIDRALTVIDRWLLDRGRRPPTVGSPSTGTSEPTGGARRSTIRSGLLALLSLLTLFIYLGLVTAWNWPRWPPGSSYRYDSLAQAFVRGKVELLISPSPALAELDNPYDPAARTGIEVIGDLSYFDGSYYLYWGPTPAALSSIWLLLDGSPISDNLIVLLSVSLMVLFSALTVLQIQREYFPGMPHWLVLGSLVLAATVHPTLWTLNSPSVFTAAISSGQAFFIGGMYFLLTALSTSRPRPWRYLVSGTLWALAVGCRLTLLAAVGPVVLLVIAMRLRALFGGRNARQELYRMAGLLLPLAIGVAALGAYNFARFGDPLESGFSYQMVGYDQGEALRQGLIFNYRYLSRNILHYLATPIRLEPEFPFLRPWWGAYPPFDAFLSRFNVPQQHSVQNAAGLIYVTPALLLGALLLMDALSCKSVVIPSALDAPGRSSGSLTLRQIVLVVSMSGLALAAVALLYRVSAGRFLMEVTPSFGILSAVGGMKFRQESQHLPARRTAINLLIASTIAVSALIGFLLALSGADSRFDDANPGLYAFLVHLFSRK